MTRTESASRPRRPLAVGVALVAIVGLLPLSAAAEVQPLFPDPDDPRSSLEPGDIAEDDGEVAVDPTKLAETHAVGIEHLGLTPKPLYPFAPGAFDYANINSDLAFTGEYAVSGNYLGFGIYDVSDPAEPEVAAVVQCRGGQGDVSVYGDLVFMSVEQTSGQVDCSDDADPDNRFRGVRIFDIGGFLADGDAASIEQVATVPTCRGSHTHTIVEDLADDGRIYVYVSGTAGVLNLPGLLDGCSSEGPQDPNEARWRIDVIEVPLDAPEDAAVIGGPRIFAEGEDDDYRIDGLQQEPPTPQHPSGTNWFPTPVTRSCHDITAYPEIGLAAGACEGNGILLDISDPANPVRVAEAADPNFAYWHSATFNNDGTKVVFTDEWGGGIFARCQATMQMNWGANGIYDIVEGADGIELEFASYYKLPAAQADNETCVAHNGNLIPVPDRDVMVQAWYEGGVSVFDFTDSSAPREIASFDRGPYHPEVFHQGGYWSVYWHDGYIYGNEIFLGFDAWALTPTDDLSQGEIDAARAWEQGETNAQAQVRYETSLEVPPPGRACDGRTRSFTDVRGGPHATNIGCIAAFGIARGTGDGSTFRPDRSVRRDQMASFLHRLLEVAGAELPTDAPDAWRDDDDSVHEEAIDALTAMGIIKGTRGGGYDPGGSVTRDQMASFLVRTVEEILDVELRAPRSPFTDIRGSVHRDNIDVAHALGIAEGRTATTYLPRRDVRRDQMGSFLARTLEHLAAEGVELTPLG